MKKSITYVCMCGGKYRWAFAIFEDGSNHNYFRVKRNCQCYYKVEDWQRLYLKYSYKNGTWKKGGKEKAEQELLATKEEKI